jgi:hypothetical protein
MRRIKLNCFSNAHDTTVHQNVSSYCQIIDGESLLEPAHKLAARVELLEYDADYLSGNM